MTSVTATIPTGFDHTLMAEKSDDDHLQYHTDARGDARYPSLATMAEVTGSVSGHVDDATIHFTAGSVDHNNLQNLTSQDDHTQYIALDPGASDRNKIVPTLADYIPLTIQQYGGGGAGVNLFEAYDFNPALMFTISEVGLATAYGGFDAQSNKIVSVADPTGIQDAATKNYVDTHTGAAATFHALSGLADTDSTLTTAASGQMLFHDGSAWTTNTYRPSAYMLTVANQAAGAITTLNLKSNGNIIRETIDGGIPALNDAILRNVAVSTYATTAGVDWVLRLRVNGVAADVGSFAFSVQNGGSNFVSTAGTWDTGNGASISQGDRIELFVDGPSITDLWLNVSVELIQSGVYV